MGRCSCHTRDGLGQVRECFDLKLSSLLGSSRYRLFVPGGGRLCEDCICSCVVPHISSCLSKVRRSRLESLHVVCREGLWSLCPSLCSLACGLWRGSELSLWVSVFCYCASSLVSKTTFRTSHPTPYSLERNWPLSCQSVNNFPQSFFIYTIWEGNFIF